MSISGEREPTVSIHAPGRGATRTGNAPQLPLRVSIHAPGRGATLSELRIRSSTSSFNSRTREGCDGTISADFSSSRMFQFTHPGGVRLVLRGFQSLISQVSIHAPGRGATPCSRYIACLSKVSIHAPGRGATIVEMLRLRITDVSIHAPGRGATVK